MLYYNAAKPSVNTLKLFFFALLPDQVDHPELPLKLLRSPVTGKP